MILALAAGEVDENGLARCTENNISDASGRQAPRAPSISA
jgi:hypothetical protein